MSKSDTKTLEALFDHALDLLCIASVDGMLLKISPSWSRQLGWDEKYLLETPFIDMIHPSDRDATKQKISQLGDGESVVDFENRYRAKTGEYHWLQWRANVLEEAGTIYAVARDVTEAKEEQMRRLQDLRLLEMAEQTAQVGHWHLDAITGQLKWSNQIFQIYGRKANKQNITLDDFIDAFLGQDRKDIWSLIQQSMQDGSEIDTEARLVRSDGEIRTVTVRAVCERSSNNVIQGLFGILQDITVEREHQVRMRSKEELLSIAFRATSDGIWDWDLKTDQVWYSPQWKAQLGYGEDELVNHFDTWASLVFEEDRLEAMEKMTEHFAGKTDRIEMIQRFRHKNGHTVFILVRAFAVKDELDRAVRVVGAHTDVTELKRLEQAKSEFTSIVSHELRTPLTAIHGAIGLLNGHYADQLPEQARSLVSVANNNSDRLILLVNDILDMEKLQSGKMDFDLREIALGEFLPQAIENHIAYGEKFNVQLDYDHTADELAIIGDANRLMQVLSNLLSNAIKFSKEGATVKIRAQKRADRVAIAIIDQGRGIPKDMQDKVFDKFIQADSSDQRHKGGTGLGLAISKAMVENMQGFITLVSEPDKGSTFTVSMPRAEDL